MEKPKKKKRKTSTDRSRPPPSKSNNKRNDSGGSFTNIASVKSAASVDSAASVASNFNQRSQVEKFNDKKESLKTARLAKIRDLTNNISDQRVLGQQSYDQAKRDIESGDWEKEIKGMEMIVSIARDKPEVGTFTHIDPNFVHVLLKLIFLVA